MGMAGALLAFTLTGCSETVDEGPVPFKGTTDPSIDALRDNMSKAMKTQDYKKLPPAETTKPGDAKPADTKPADTKAADKKN
jgi:tripartite-type tricarboxylate transporter receptor subunit TctC